MKVLVTGGAGYIGSVVTAQLLEAGHEVIVLDNLSVGHEDAISEGARFIKADLSDAAKVLKPEDGIEAVVHLAAFAVAGESVTKPEMYWQNNVVATLDLLTALRNLGIKKLIFASTCATYGNPITLPLAEDHPTNPTNTYGMTKLAMDMAITSEAIGHDLAAISLRFFNVAGAYGRFGERHPIETHIIPLALEVAAGKRPVFTIFGDDYPTDDGTCVRDYIHVADLALAIRIALDKLAPGKHEIYNLGNGNGFSNKQVIAAVEAVTGKKLSVEVGARREGDPAIAVGSSEKAKRELGWVPERPSLEAMIRDAWEFYNNPPTNTP